MTVVEMKLEVVQVPVSDVDRARDFYSEQLGFDVDVDRVVPGGMRVAQLTPPGSGYPVPGMKGWKQMWLCDGGCPSANPKPSISRSRRPARPAEDGPISVTCRPVPTP